MPETFLVAFSFAGEQRDSIRALAEEVERQLGRGTVFLDEWFQHYLAGQNADLKLKDLYHSRCELVVFCISQNYDQKSWTKAEYEAIRSRQMKLDNSPNEGDKHRILPLRVGDGEVEGMYFNAIVPDIRSKTLAESARLILDRLELINLGKKSIPNQRSPLKTWPKNPPKLDWPMANHFEVREAFGSLVTRSTKWRYLPVIGHTETGKSHLTKQMLANGMQLPNTVCGRFDFKGTTNVEAEMTSFAQFLQVELPDSKGNSRLNEKLNQVLCALKSRASPALLIFDTYEAAGDAQDWVDKQLLPNLLLCPWLRVVIAGQRVPDAKGATWISRARSTLALKPPPPKDWFEYGKQHIADLTLDDVETVCRLATHKPGLLAQLLGPKD